MILYIQNPKGSTKKVLELLNEFSKVSGYKINIQKLVEFLYANKELTKRKIKKTIPFTIATTKIINVIVTTVGKHLTKEVKDLCIENYKTLNKEIEGDTNKCKHILCSWIELTSLKWPYYPNSNCIADSMQFLS